MSGTMRAAAWGVAVVFGLLAPAEWAGAQEKPAASAPITREDSLKFGEDLAEAFHQLDAKAIEKAVDFFAVMEASTEGVKAPPRVRGEFLEGAKEALERGKPPLLAELQPLIQAGADLRATKALPWQGQPACLVRWLYPDSGAGYILFILKRADDGRVRAVDYYSLATGELASQVVRRLYLAAVAEANRGVVDRLLGKEQAIIKHMGDLQRMVTLNRDGKPAEVLKIFDALPEELKSEKIFQTQRYTAASQVGDDAKYLEAIQDFAKHFPGDPACDFLLIDGHLMTNPPEPEKALACIDRLDQTLGGDAYLKVLRGNILFILKRSDDALASYRAAIAAEPDLRPAYDELLNASLELKRFNVVAEALDALEGVFDEEIVDLSEIDEFAEFLASPEGKAWTAKRAKAKDGDEAPKP